VKLENNASARYISDPKSIFRFVSLDNVKRNVKTDSTSVVFHTSVNFGAENVEKTVDQVRSELVAEAEKLFPNWPKPDNVKCQKWRYSQVNKIK
jgi:predicted NAD/FAD-dependent oxidoreductase